MSRLGNFKLIHYRKVAELFGAIACGNATQRSPETQGKDAPSDHASAYHVCFRATIDWAIALSTQHSYSAHYQDIVVPSLQFHALCLD
jgi:hypothetical protein